MDHASFVLQLEREPAFLPIRCLHSQKTGHLRQVEGVPSLQLAIAGKSSRDIEHQVYAEAHFHSPIIRN